VSEAVFIFPHHLFEKHPALAKNRMIFAIEDPLFFGDSVYKARFHKLKITFHRASMKAYAEKLKDEGYRIYYINAEDIYEADKGYSKLIEQYKIRTLYVTELTDYILKLRIEKLCQKANITLTTLPSPQFLTSVFEFEEMVEDSKLPFFFHNFYIKQRKRLNILIDGRGKPVGGKWSLDAENRKKAPKNLRPPPLPHIHDNPLVKEAYRYSEANFALCPGTATYLPYPTTHKQAHHFLTDFLQNRLALFGDYEDAMVASEPILYHSLLSPLLNCGLLTPEEVLSKTLDFAEENTVSLNSLEGFLRQIIGWREFIRGVYMLVGSKQRKSNFFHHRRKIPLSFYTATTGITPVDMTIRSVLETGYCHHIQRLMVLGNFLLLCEVDPDDVYLWFMELFIDAYDWVMVPNVYGMSQYADGGMMTTKPYLSGSNYLLKMSDYPKGPWTAIWDGLFWRFLIKHMEFFDEQPRMQVLCKMAKKKKNDTRLLAGAESFLHSLG
jgi:deoxyribodipyrimidine photolyase-related protein